MSRNKKGFFVIDIILLIVVVLIAVLFLISGYPSTVGSIINIH